MGDLRAAQLARRVAASKKAASSSRRIRAFMETGAPVQDMPERGTARGDFSPRELIDRIRAAGPSTGSGQGPSTRSGQGSG